LAHFKMDLPMLLSVSVILRITKFFHLSDYIEGLSMFIIQVRLAEKKTCLFKRNEYKVEQIDQNLVIFMSKCTFIWM